MVIMPSTKIMHAYVHMVVIYCDVLLTFSWLCLFPTFYVAFHPIAELDNERSHGPGKRRCLAMDQLTIQDCSVDSLW